MRNLTRALCLLFVFAFAISGLQAQNELTKEETKYWKNKAKEYRRNLPALKALVESRDAAEDQVVALQQEANSLRTDLALKDRQIAGYEEQLANLNQRIIAAEAGANAVTNPQPAPPITQPATSTGTAPAITGTVFRVQIAALSQKKIDLSLATGNAMMLMEDRNGTQKVMVGEFRSYANARVLRDRLRQIGVDGAFVQAFQDGQPIDIQTAVQYTGETVD